MSEEHANEVGKSRSSRKKTSIILVLLLVAALGGLFWVVMPPKEPSYNGKPLSYWLARYEEVGPVNPEIKNPEATECRDAIRHMGTNAIPALLRMLRAKDPAFKLELIDLFQRQNFINHNFSLADEQNEKAAQGFLCLNELATSSIPALVDIYNDPQLGTSKEYANSALMAIFPASVTTIPYWVPQNERAQWCENAGQIKFQLGDMSNAIPAFSGAINLNPTNASAFAGRASSKYNVHDFPGALSDIERSIELDGSNQPAFYLRGMCKSALNDFKSADADFTTAINLNTNDTDSYNNRGLARAKLRKLDDALADFNQTVALSPQSAVPYRNRALVEGLQKEYELASADLSKSIELDGKDGLAYVVRGHIENVLKDYKAALRDFGEALELDPNSSAAYAGQGATRMYMDDFENASADLEKALQLDPKNVSAYVTRGYLEAKRGGQDDEALADFERAVALGKQPADTHAVLGLFQYKLSQWDSALKNCRKAQELGNLGSEADLRSYIWLIRAQTGEENDASQELETYLKSLRGAKTNQWEASIARFFSGSLVESNFLSQATTTAKRPSAVRGQVCESFYYAGMKRKLAGDQQGALKLFQQCLDTKDDNSFSYLNAGVEVNALKNN